MAAREWLETDGLGGYAGSTVEGTRTRRYHGMLIAATRPPTGRFMVVSGFDASVETAAGTFALRSQRYAPDVVAPPADRVIESFERDPWPAWTLRLPDGTRLRHEIFMRHGRPLTAMSWRLLSGGPARLEVRPFLSGRDHHGLHHANPDFRFEPEQLAAGLRWRPYPGVPALTVRSNGEYRHEPHWYTGFLYEEERQRGFDCVEDLASPGVFVFDLARGEAAWVLESGHEGAPPVPADEEDLHAERLLGRLRDAERTRRHAFATPLHRAADCYLVRRGRGRTIVAGYPWFTDWGRDTFIAMRGLLLATGRLDEAFEILAAWAGTISRGMVPNRFPDQGGEPEYNSVDASLWYVVAVHDFLVAAAAHPGTLAPRDERLLRDAVDGILRGYSAGTRYGIGRDDDGLLAAGEPGQQLTWMDARVDGREVTPRIGKPVEVQALWINALWIGARFDASWNAGLGPARQSFVQRFWNPQRRCLFDVVDVDHRSGAVDGALRPNQVLAVGGLPLQVLPDDRAASVLEVVERHLWTPYGLRTLAPHEPGYVPRYEGGPAQRDAAYHQGTVWPWLAGPFVEAWLRVNGGRAGAASEARARFVEPLLAHLDELGVGHLPEIADGDPPHSPRGCPFQAWSLGELLRVLALPALAPRVAASDRRAVAV